MAKKMKFLSLLKNKDATRFSYSSWCHQPRTLSLRVNINNDIVKTMNSAYIDTTIMPSPESLFTKTPESASASFSTASEEERRGGVDPIETLIREVRSDRLFFEPDETSSLFDAKACGFGTLPFKDSVVMAMDSQDPYVDFRKSMEEMVQAHGVKDWEGLEELLVSYLKLNGESNHGYIVKAFVDLLVGFAPSSSHSHSPSSPFSFYNSYQSSSPSSSLLLEQVKEDMTPEDGTSSSPSNA